MYAIRRPLIILLATALIALTGLVGCSSAPTKASHGYTPPPTTQTASSSRAQADDAPVAARTEAAAAPAPLMGSGPATASQPSMAERHAVSDQGGSAQSGASGGERAPEAKPPEVEETPSRGQLLIYSGALVLAIYEVEKTQDEAVAYIDEIGGYVSQRTSKALTARVPAAKFRPAMERLGELGDVLDRSWEAQDVTDQVRDLDIRLRNSLGLRDRLEALLDEAESVEDALQIEAELERITLEIERIRGQLKSFEDRIAYSTIQIEFRARRTDEVPQEDFLLPFDWLNTLGLQSLLRSPKVYR
jgi:hypothetical protein